MVSQKDIKSTFINGDTPVAEPLARRRTRIAKPPEVRRDDLMRAALSVFVEKGIGATAISDITERADLAKGTYYLYFHSKDEIVGALWQGHVDGLLQTAKRLLASMPDGANDRIVLLLSALARHTLGHADLHKLVYSSADAAALELCRRSNQKLIDLLATEMRTAKGSAYVSNAALDRLATFIFHGAHGALHDFIMSNNAGEADAFLSATSDFVRAALRSLQQGSEAAPTA